MPDIISTYQSTRVWREDGQEIWTAGMREKLVGRAQQAELSGLRELLALASSKSYINLGPGICDLQPHARVVEAGRKAFSSRVHSYAPCDGVPELKQAISDRYLLYNGITVMPENVQVTCGATGGLDSICKCFVNPGDEVILFEPFYQYHLRQVLERGGIPCYVRLRRPDWSVLLEDLKEAITDKTKCLVMSNPNNPTGRVFAAHELEQIGRICRDAGVIVVCDEVYEYFTSEESSHISMASIPGMFEHTLTLSSASKTFSVTGWRIGWIIGPENIMQSLAVKSDETYLCAPTPLQHAVAECLQFEGEFFTRVSSHFHKKRIQLCSALQEAGFTVNIPEGAFYILAGYDQLQYDNDLDAVKGLIQEFGIVVVPGKEFLAGSSSSGLLRFCFAVEQELLDAACERLTGHKNAGPNRASAVSNIVSHM